MDNKTANMLRLHANEIMRQLYEAGQLDQLRILEIYATRCLEIAKEKTGKVPRY